MVLKRCRAYEMLHLRHDCHHRLQIEAQDTTLPQNHQSAAVPAVSLCLPTCRCWQNCRISRAAARLMMLLASQL